MSFPELPQILKFCDDSNHRKDISTKHNLLCDQRSTWNVISQHHDFDNRFRIPNEKFDRSTNRNPLNIRVVKESFSHNLVVAFEISKSMKEVVSRFNYQKESIAQFLLYEAPSSSSIGLVSFAGSSFQETPSLYSMKEKENRKRLAKIVMTKKVTNDDQRTNLLTAIKDSSQLLSTGNGMIMLITKCTEETIGFSAEELASAAAGHAVWIVLYPKTSSKNLGIFSKLALLTGGKLMAINDEIITGEDGSHISPNVRLKLSQSLRQILHLDPTLDIRQIDYKVCDQSEAKCLRRMTIPPNRYYTKLLLFSYHESGDIINLHSSSVEVSGGFCAHEYFVNFTNSVKTTEVEKCNINEQTEEIRLEIVRMRHHDDLILELVGRPKFNISRNQFQYRVFGSTNLFDLKYTKKSAPIIYFQLLYKELQVFGANITAEFRFKENHIPLNISLKDDGKGADVTGNDGIYSGYILPVLPIQETSFTIYANDASGQAKLSPDNYDSERPYVCCGSVIPLPNDLRRCPEFTMTTVPVSATITQSFNDLNLPPGQIVDLKIFNQRPKSVNLTFTSTGEDLDFGRAKRYIVKFNSGKVIDLKKVPLTSGSTESVIIKEIICNVKNIVSIAAVDKQGYRGKYSNQVILYVPCSRLSSGAKIGLSIAIIIIIIIAVVLCFLYHQRKRKNLSNFFNIIFCAGDKSYIEVPLENIKNDCDKTIQEIKTIDDLVFNLCESNEQVQAIDAFSRSENKTKLENVYAEIRENLDQEEKLKYLSDQKTLYKYNVPPNVTKDDENRSLDNISLSSRFASQHSINQVGIPLS